MVLLILFLSTAIFTSVTAALVRERARIQNELDLAKKSKNEGENSVYEETKAINNSLSAAAFETKVNTAYACASKVCI